MTRGLGNKRTSGHNPNYNIAEIDQNTEKSPGDLRRLVVTQPPVKDHQHYWVCQGHIAQWIKALVRSSDIPKECEFNTR